MTLSSFFSALRCLNICRLFDNAVLRHVAALRSPEWCLLYTFSMENRVDAAFVECTFPAQLGAEIGNEMIPACSVSVPRAGTVSTEIMSSRDGVDTSRRKDNTSLLFRTRSTSGRDLAAAVEERTPRRPRRGLRHRPFPSPTAMSPR